MLPTAALEAYAERKGQRWSTDEITDGLAARAEDTARIGQDPVTAYVRGRQADDECREAGWSARSPGRPTAVSAVGRLPEGRAGASVFKGRPLAGDALKSACVGMARRADGHGFGHHPLAVRRDPRGACPGRRPPRWAGRRRPRRR